ncbi:MAG: RNA-binding S4 domain-containing protein [Clostridia bacterium]|nr:RNA-binding S4 domain-containing protein [Clostridia bacterium]
MKSNLSIYTPFIRLKDALKFAGAAENGAAAKQAVADGKVQVNGEICTQSGKKLTSGDSFTYQGEEFVITNED